MLDPGVGASWRWKDEWQWTATVEYVHREQSHQHTSQTTEQVKDRMGIGPNCGFSLTCHHPQTGHQYYQDNARSRVLDEPQTGQIDLQPPYPSATTQQAKVDK